MKNTTKGIWSTLIILQAMAFEVIMFNIVKDTVITMSKPRTFTVICEEIGDVVVNLPANYDFSWWLNDAVSSVIFTAFVLLLVWCEFYVLNHWNIIKEWFGK